MRSYKNHIGQQQQQPTRIENSKHLTGINRFRSPSNKTRFHFENFLARPRHERRVYICETPVTADREMSLEGFSSSN